MADLATRAEIAHLARELGTDEDALAFLEDRPAADVRALKADVARVLADDHRSVFAAMARAAKLLPTPILAPIAERAVGPMLCSKIAAELDPAFARKVVGAFSVPFLADLCRTLDAHAAGDVIAAIPSKRAVPVGFELLARRDLDTLAKFVDVVTPEAIPPVLEALDEDALLRIAVVAERRDRISAVFSMLDDARVLALVDAAVRTEVLEECLVVVAELEAAQVVRVIETVIDAGEPLVADVVGAIASLGAWDRLLPVVASLDPAHVAAIASAPVISRPDVFEGIVAHVVEAGAVEDFVTVVAAIPEPTQAELAGAVADAAPELARRLLELADEHGVTRLPALDALVAALG